MKYIVQFILPVFTLFINHINAQVPTCPTAFNPNSGATNQPLSDTRLTWKSVSSANAYDIYLSTSDPSLQIWPTRSTNDTVSNFGDLLPNTTYYWQVRPKNSYGAATGCPVQHFITGSEVANNECTNAEDISDRLPHNGNTWFANWNGRFESCKGIVSAGADVWYTFTILSPETVKIKVVPNSPWDFDPIIFAYSGTCSSLQPIGCVDSAQGTAPEILTLQNLAPGTYYVRVYQWGGDVIDPTFNISIENTVLPIKLSSFTARLEGSKVLLNWKTEMEQNNHGFEVERSGDGTTFNRIAFVPSKGIYGNSSISLEYNFKDSSGSLNRSNYYRLRQIDRDGRMTYSGIVNVNIQENVNFAVASLYPNPAKEVVNLSISSTIKENISIVVADLQGRAVIKKRTLLLLGSNSIPINVSGIGGGVYVIKLISSKGDQISEKFFKQ